MDGYLASWDMKIGRPPGRAWFAPWPGTASGAALVPFYLVIRTEIEQCGTRNAINAICNNFMLHGVWCIVQEASIQTL